MSLAVLESFPKSRLKALLDHFALIEDPREPWRVAHPLPEILLLVVCGTICDGEDYDLIAAWGEANLDVLRRYAPYHHGVPGGRWLTLLMNRIAPGLFAQVFTDWVRATWPERPDLVAIDAKTSRRSHDRSTGAPPLHLVSAFATTARLVLGQEAVPDKASETAAIPVLIERLAEKDGLKDAIVSIDAIATNAAIATANRLGCAIETLRAALNVLAAAAPDWLRRHADPAWSERYERRADDVDVPKGEVARRAFSEIVGRDGDASLTAVSGPDAPSWLRKVPAVEVLRRVWVQNFCRVNDDTDPPAPDKPPTLRWRTETEGFPPSTIMIASPYDLDVHYAKKRTTTWIGYKVHLTETCETDQPPLITHVETTTAPVTDRAVLADVHGALKHKALLPARHLVDAGYIDADQLVTSAHDHAITLVGPPPADNQWQARDLRRFHHRAVRPRLGAAGRHLPGREDERELEARHQLRSRQRPHPVFSDALQGLPPQGPLHALEPPCPRATPARGA